MVYHYQRKSSIILWFRVLYMYIFELNNVLSRSQCFQTIPDYFAKISSLEPVKSKIGNYIEIKRGYLDTSMYMT